MTHANGEHELPGGFKVSFALAGGRVVVKIKPRQPDHHEWKRLKDDLRALKADYRKAQERGRGGFGAAA